MDQSQKKFMEICIKHKQIFLIDLEDDELRKDRNINLLLDYNKCAFSTKDTLMDLKRKNY